MGNAPGEGAVDAAGRNAYVDFLRASSLIIVVIWHWAFTLLYWRPDGPRATSPLRFFDGLWLLTWLFQVMPLFFYIGGYVHLRSWERAQTKGIGLGPFVLRRLRQLAVPALALLFGWIVLGSLVGLLAGPLMKPPRRGRSARAPPRVPRVGARCARASRCRSTAASS